ncbi:MAG: T9SS type A sorting domain-containing protein [Bacteroidia bacterium]|nr:T9SS type A sorting domain-containing protein [Bacteroidia bacterium]
MKQIFTLLLFCYSSISIAATYPIGRQSLTIIDPNRSNRSIDLELVYPAVTSGTQTAIADGSFPLVSFGHGFQMTYDAYSPIYDSLASWGYVVANLKTEGSFSPSHTDFGKDLAFVVDYFLEQNTQSSSFLFGKLNGKSAIGGHSMGGGASLLASQFTTNETCIFNFAAAETNPSAIAQCSLSVDQPLLMLAGTYDLVTPTATNQEPMYQAAISGCKFFVNLTGAYHCRFAGTSITCEFGETVLNPPSGGLSRDQQLQLTRTILRPWLDYWLQNNSQAWNQFSSIVASQQGFTSLTSCEQSMDETRANQVRIYPNPGKSQLIIEPISGSKLVRIVDMYGKQLVQISAEGKNKLVLDLNLSSGLYLVYVDTMAMPAKWLVE